MVSTDQRLIGASEYFQRTENIAGVKVNILFSTIKMVVDRR